MNELARLAERTSLPEDMRALIREFPRETWAGRTGPFTAFYLERHELFRMVLAKLNSETQGFIDGGDPRHYGVAISRYASFFLNELHGHHQIEDQWYFPRLQKLDPRAERAFDLLETDHVDLHGALDRFESLARRSLAEIEGETRFAAADAFLTQLGGIERLLDRHLADEEDIVVPLMLKYGEESVGH